MAKIKREELSGKFLEAFDKIVKLKNSDDAKQREAGLKGEKALEKLLSSKKGEAVKKEVKPKASKNNKWRSLNDSYNLGVLRLCLVIKYKLRLDNTKERLEYKRQKTTMATAQRFL